tara:strand:- start:63 stop:695 length:633 start_codon:yes stop_codon:yes gene_type:complete
MFTGIIESLGTINNIQESKSSLKVAISVSDIIFNEAIIGASIAINGVCLTVVKKEKNQNLLFFDIINETLSKTNLKSLRVSEKVNLETALKFGNGLDGHMVQGHIDTIGTIVNNQLVDDNWLLEIMIDKHWIKYCIQKGSIAIDGISLTISSINEKHNNQHGIISISIIPHTLDNTNLKHKSKDDTVNIETDFFGKYIEKFLQARMEHNE